MLLGQGGRLPASVTGWLALFVVAVVAGAICLAVSALVMISLTWISIALAQSLLHEPVLPGFPQPSLEGVASNALIYLHYPLLVCAGVLVAVVLLTVVSAIPIRLRRRQRYSEVRMVGSGRLLARAVLLVLACALLLGGGEIARWYAETILPDQLLSPAGLTPGHRLRTVSYGLLTSAGVMAALALAQAMNAVVRGIRARSANSDPPPVHRDDAGSIPHRVPPGILFYWVVGFVVVAAAGYVCLSLGAREFPADLRPDAIWVTGSALERIGRGLLAGAGVLVALAWLQSVSAIDPRPAGLLTGARSLVTGFGVMVLAAAIVYWLTRSVILAAPPSYAIPVAELDSIILFGRIVLWEGFGSLAILSLIVGLLAHGLIIGTAVAAITALLQSYPLVKQRLGGASADRDANTPPFLAAVLGFIAVLLAGALCLSLGREVALADPPRSFAHVLIPIQFVLSSGLFIGAGVLAAVMVTVALGALQRRVSERRSQDSPA